MFDTIDATSSMIDEKLYFDEIKMKNTLTENGLLFLLKEFFRLLTIVLST